MNQFTLTACIVERQPVRYTPAGIPVLGFTLAHSGEVVEADSVRVLKFELSALAIGDIARALERVDTASAVVWTGFLAPRKQGAKHFDFHVTRFENAVQCA